MLNRFVAKYEFVYVQVMSLKNYVHVSSKLVYGKRKEQIKCNYPLSVYKFSLCLSSMVCENKIIISVILRVKTFFSTI